MPEAKSIEHLNIELARRINDEACQDPHSPYAGKFVGIANGKVVVVADNLDDVAARLIAVEPDMTKRFCIEAGIDYDAPAEIWMLH
jgi:hypothetical protein